jgi:hypothetical protein
MIAELLGDKPRMTGVYFLEGLPDLVIKIEVLVRRKTVTYFMDILDTTDGLIDDIHVFPIPVLSTKFKLRRLAAVQVENQNKEMSYYV